MKRSLQSVGTAIVLAAGVLTWTACGGKGSSGGGPPPGPATLNITTTSLPNGVVGTAYTQNLAVTGGTGARTFSISSGSLPAGFNPINAANGQITGTPSGPAGTSNFTVTVVDSGNPQQSDSQALSITIDNPPPPNITTTSLPNAVEGAAYNQTIQVSGGFGALTFSISNDMLPAGLGLNSSTGVISGIPTDPTDDRTFTVMVVDSTPGTPQSDTQVLTLNVDPAPPVTITTTSLPNATIGTAYNSTLARTGGAAPFTWSITSGMPPDGLGLDSNTGVISGTPSGAATTQTFTVRVDDSATTPTFDTQMLTINLVANLGRNNTIGTATPLSNGTFAASISPYGDPAGTTDPDVDVYQVTATAGNTVTIMVTGPGLGSPSPIDPLFEIVNASNVRFLTGCRNQGNDDGVTGAADPTPNAFDDVCLNDDIQLGIITDSFMEFQVPGAGNVTFYVRVLDFRGDARPDLLYEISISGAN